MEDLPEQVIISVQQQNQSEDLFSDLRKLVMSAVPKHLHHLVGYTSSQEHTDEASKMEMASARNTAIFPDICFCVGDQEFECHKIFFYGRSEYFRIMLIEKQDDQPPAMEGYRPVVKLDNVTAEDFVQVISYLYQDHCLATNQSLLEVCDRWALPRLKLQLTNEAGGVTVSNVMQMYIANRQNEFILQKCYQCVDENFMEVASHYEFHQFIKRDIPSHVRRNQQFTSPFVSGLLHHMRSTAHTWHEQRFANDKIKKLNYIVSNRLGYSANFTLFDVPPVPPHCMGSTATSNDNGAPLQYIPTNPNDSGIYRRGTTHFPASSVPSAPPQYMTLAATSNDSGSDRRGTTHFPASSVPSAPPQYMTNRATSNDKKSERRDTSSNFTPSSVPSAPPQYMTNTATSNDSGSERRGTSSEFTPSSVPAAPPQYMTVAATSNDSGSDRRGPSSNFTPSSVPSAPPKYMTNRATSNDSGSDRRGPSSNFTPSSVPSAPPKYMTNRATSNDSGSDRRGPSSNFTPSSVPSAPPKYMTNRATSNDSGSDRRGTSSEFTPSSVPSAPPQRIRSTETLDDTNRTKPSSSKTKSCAVS